MDDPQPSVPDEPEFMTVRQAARHLNVSQRRVHRLCTARKLAHYKLGDGRALRIRRIDLLEFIRHCRIERRVTDEGPSEPRRKRVKQAERVYEGLDLRPERPCGAITKAGTPCKRMTADERCPQHHAGTN